MTPSPVDDLRPRVQYALDRFLSAQRGILAEASPELVPLVDASADLVRGGKRLRPAFCYWGWRGAGRTDNDAIVAAASALELFQGAALVHDDVIDAADTRRGQPAIHRRFEALHRNEGWHRDAGAFGVAAAVLVGDLLLGWSDEMLSSSGLHPDELQRGRPEFDRMRTEVGGGQYLDVLEQARGGLPAEARVDRARRVITYKSARYSVERPVVMGGLFADATPDLQASYSAYGAALGQAYQLRDDILGVFGDPSVTGKPAGDDLREGKRTLLIAYALERATPPQADLLTTQLGNPAMSDAGTDALRDVIVETKALERTESLVDDLVTDAHTALGKADVTDEARDALASLIDLATTRSS